MREKSNSAGCGVWNNMPAFGQPLSADEIRQVHAYLMSRDRP